MEAAEALFAADSAAVLTQLHLLSAHQDIAAQALAAASLLDLANAVLGGPSAATNWLLGHPEHASGAPAQDRDMRRQALRLADREVLRQLPGGSEVADAWTRRSEAAARYTACLTSSITRHTPDTVLGSVLHLHHVRALGIDPQGEAITYKLARAVALSRAARSREEGQR
ncbi:thiopeptide-type bacteriocin biosynthesis protein [Streptomyces sp. x-80]|uniref:thiopeptide-type bacteriocin biosynthesis protein n=1 Tax=Streptomyces sp. x-80 TaxID=2789282 RepID=UPI00397FDF7F